MSLTTHLLSAAAAFLIAFVTATGGITGAFLLVPFQISVLGLGGPAVSGTNHFYNVVAAPGGFVGYWRQGRLFWPVAAVMVAGTVPGIALGIGLRVRYLLDPGLFRIYAGAVLLALGIVLLVRTSLSRRRGGTKEGREGEIVVERFDWRRLRFRFGDRSYSAGVLPLFLFSLAIGAIGGAYGVGGGVFTSAYLVGVCGLPVYAVAGATLFATFVASCAGALGFALVSWTGVAGETATSPLWTLGLAMGAGGWLGGYFGSRVQKFVPSVVIGVVLALLLVALGVSYIF